MMLNLFGSVFDFHSYHENKTDPVFGTQSFFNVFYECSLFIAREVS